ncbi:relaxase/mobilization nuclease domain-containing protein [Ferruginibacter sp.]|nr:hypothetical protein [Ferruginibacter sp.]
MIIKSLSRKSNPAQLIKYALRYSLKENDKQAQKEHATVLLRHNLRSKDIEGCIIEFKENEAYRIYKRKDSVILFHTILSFAPEDTKRITKVMLKDIAQKFVQLRGSDCLNLAVSHTEKQHKHIHVLTSGVKINGRSSRVSKQTFTHILNELEKYQQEKYSNLIYSKNSHTKTKIADKEQLVAYLQKTRKSNKLSLLTHLEKAYQNAQSKDEFIQILASNDYEIYFRNGRPQGILAEGKKFRFTSLNFGTESFDKLNERELEKSQALTQIQAIRNREIKPKEITKEKVLEPGKPLDELESIEAIREKVKEHDHLEIARETEFEPIRIRGMGKPHEHFNR